MKFIQIILFFGISSGILQQEQAVRILRGHDWSVTALDIDKHGTLLLSGGWDNTMILWDLTSDSIIYKFDNHSNMIWDVAFSPNGRYAASASWDASINLWDIESKELVHKLKHAQKFRLVQTEPFYQDRMVPNMINTIAFSPEGSKMASGSSDGMIRIWDLKSGELSELIDIHDSVSVGEVLFNKTATKLISSSNIIKIYDLKNKVVEMNLDGHHGQLIGDLDIDNSGKLLISGDIAVRNPLIALWDLETGDQIRTLEGHRKVIRDIAFSNDESMIASAGEDNLVILWSVQTGESISTYTDHDQKELNAICFSPNDQMIIYGSQDKTIKFRSIENDAE